MDKHRNGDGLKTLFLMCVKRFQTHFKKYFDTFDMNKTIA